MLWQSVFSGDSSTYTFTTGLPASLSNLPKLLLNLQSSHSLHSLHFAPWHSPYSRYTYMPAVTPAPHPTVEPTADSLLIKMLKDTSYVDTGESTNLAQSITNVGLDSGLNQGMTSFTSGTLSTELNGFDCFVVPELERGNFYSALSSTDITAVASWVSEGRVMVVSADYNGRAVSLLNGVFGWSLSLGSTSSGLTASITSAASGTAFEAGPSTLYGPNGNYALTSSSIPSNGSSIYT